MVKIVTLYYRILPNVAHYNYFTYVREVLDNAAPVVRTALSALLPSFNEWLTKEEQLIEWVYKRTFSTQILESIRCMEHILAGISSQTMGLKHDPEPAVAKAAQRIHRILNHYEWECYKANETLSLSNDMQAILMKLQGNYAADVATLGLAEGVSILETAFTEFQAWLAQRDAQALKKPADTIVVVRHNIDKLYRKMTSILNARAIISMDVSVFVAVIHQLNPEIERLNAEYHYPKYAILYAELAPIPPQPYAGGQPVTPSPDVYYNTLHGETKKLVRGKDYNLYYKNNTHPGTARCLLYGKGLYAGNKTVTFIIKN
jgi:hypothetical protein